MVESAGNGRGIAARFRRASAFLVVLWGLLATSSARATVFDLADADPQTAGLLRLRGSVGSGGFGVPVAGGPDVDGDGIGDFAMAAMRASPLGRFLAGQVFVVFGDGQTIGEIDTAVASPDVLTILGEGPQEHTGSEIWIDDVTGDGLGDLLIARQNYSLLQNRAGAGALTIVAGSAALSALAANGSALDLASPPPGVAVTTLVGRQALGRLGIWMRTGDITGDGVADLVVGADQINSLDVRAGEAWVLRGGPWLAGAGTIDLAEFGNTALAGHLMRLTPPPLSSGHHFGATCQIGDLDGDGLGEVMVASTLNRVGAVQPAAGQAASTARGSGGAPNGRVFIVWDENFAVESEPPIWPAGFEFQVGDATRVVTVLRGHDDNTSFGEELLPGADYDGDGTLDLFVGDLLGNRSGDVSRSGAGVGQVIYELELWKGMDVDLNAPPEGFASTLFLGAERVDIAADTAAVADFDGDGRMDLAFSAPDADPLGRVDAGVLWIFPGRTQPWPEVVDLRDPLPLAFRAARFLGALGQASGDAGDTLAYSAAAGDLDGDGRAELIVNEMRGNGLTAGSTDVGNLLLIDAVALPAPGSGAASLAALVALAATRAWRARRGRPPAADPRIDGAQK